MRLEKEKEGTRISSSEREIRRTPRSCGGPALFTFEEKYALAVRVKGAF